MTASFFSLASLGLPVSAAQMMQTWFTAMQAAYPGYRPSLSSPEYVQAQVFASWAADTAAMCSAGSTELWRQYGTQLLGVPFEPGVAASAVATVTAVDTAGYTLPQGTQVTLTLNGAQLAFQTATTLTIPNGSSSGTVTVVALQTGVAFNGATNPAQLVSQINWVSGVSVAAPASNGVDQESDDQYVQRLASTAQLLGYATVTAPDYAARALNWVPLPATDQQEVGRATAIDGYDPTSNTLGNEREVTVCVTDANGLALNNDTLYGIGGSSGNIITNPAQWGVAGWLASFREMNFIVNVVSPNYTPVYVAVTLHAAPGFTTATVQANVQSALLAYLSPPNFGLPQGATVGWTNSQTVFHSRVEAIIQNTQGVDHVSLLAVDVNSHPTNTADLALPGPFPLPTSSVTTIPTSAITVN